MIDIIAVWWLSEQMRDIDASRARREDYRRLLESQKHYAPAEPLPAPEPPVEPENRWRSAPVILSMAAAVVCLVLMLGLGRIIVAIAALWIAIALLGSVLRVRDWARSRRRAAASTTRHQQGQLT